MNRLNTNHSIKLEVLSPLFIGTSQEKNWIRGVDFVHFQGEIFILDKERVYQDLGEDRQQKYLNLLGSRKFMELEDFIAGNIELADYATIRYGYEGRLPSNEIKSLIRDGNSTPYIPGSSIKGALASVVFAYLFQKVNPRNYNEQTVNDLLGQFGRSLFRYIRPYDGVCDSTELCNIELFNLFSPGVDWQSDYKNEFNITIENFAPEAKGEFRLSIADGMGKLFSEMEKQQNLKILPTYYHHIIQDNPLQFLFEIINKHTYTHIQKEIDFFGKFNQAEATDLIIENLESWQKATQVNLNTCVLRMGGGSGFHSITGDWRFSNHFETLEHPDRRNLVYNYRNRQKEPARYKSRKVIVNNAEVMGFVKLSID